MPGSTVVRERFIFTLNFETTASNKGLKLNDHGMKKSDILSRNYGQYFQFLNEEAHFYSCRFSDARWSVEIALASERNKVG